VSEQRTILGAIDESPLTSRYWNMAALVLVATALEFFDFFIIGFIISIIAPEWELTFGETATVLYAGGVGAIVGSFVGGWWGHRSGRRVPFIVGILVTTLCAGAIALSPVGAVWYLALLRFMVGVGLGIMVTFALTAMVELTPTKHRTYLAGLATVGLIPIGTLLAASLSAALGPIIGWRGLAAIGAIPAVLAIWAWAALPESPRWLINRDRAEEARRVVAWLTKRPEESISLDVASDRQAPETTRPPESVSYVALYRYPKSFWFTVLAWLGATTAIYGVTLWGATIFTLILDITPGQAATFFVWVTLGGFVGRISFALLGHWIGRRPAGILMGFGGAALLIVATLTEQATLGGVSLFVIAFVVGYFFIDGGFANLAPATPEVFPTRLRAHASGLAEVINGVGKILGPLGLAVIAGTSNIVNPEATKEAIAPALYFFAAFSLLTALAFMLIPETRGKTLEAVEEELEVQRRPAPSESKISS
jgi:MFS transporter, putative metabolite:H+ symporter